MSEPELRSAKPSTDDFIKNIAARGYLDRVVIDTSTVSIFC